MRRALAFARRLPPEALVWASALVALAFTDPAAEPLARLCPFAWIGDALGLAFCPGCGLGHSIAHVFRGEIGRSFAAHPAGPFAVAVLATRIGTLVRSAWRSVPTPLPHPFPHA